MGLADKLGSAAPYGRTWAITEFDNVRDKKGRARECTWSELVEMLTNNGPMAPDNSDAEKNRGGCFSGAWFNKRSRKKADITSISLLVFDFDSTIARVPFAHAIRPFEGYRWLAYASWSNTAERDGYSGIHKYRIVVPLASSVPFGEGDKDKDKTWKPVARACFWKLARGYADVALLNENQIWLKPRQGPNRVYWSATSEDDAPLYDWHELELQGRKLPDDSILRTIRTARLETAAHTLTRRIQTTKEGGGWTWPGCEMTDDDSDDSTPSDVSMLPGERAPWKQTVRMMGHLRPDGVYLLNGGTKAGKTAWALNVAEGAARSSDWPVLYVSAELGADEACARLLAIRSKERVEWSSITNGRHDLERVNEAAEQLCGDLTNFYAWSPRLDQRNADSLETMVRSVSAEHGCVPVFIVLDYLQRFGEPDASGDMRMAIRQTSGQVRELCRLSSERPASKWWPKDKPWPGAAALVVSSIPRSSYKHFANATTVANAGKGKSETTLDDLLAAGKESGELEYDALMIAALATDPPAVNAPRAPRKGVVRVLRARMRAADKPTVYLFDGGRGRWDEEANTVVSSRTLGPK